MKIGNNILPAQQKQMLYKLNKGIEEKSNFIPYAVNTNITRAIHSTDRNPIC
jgi:hypothetical protein